jgi:hypothetical protein
VQRSDLAIPLALAALGMADPGELALVGDAASRDPAVARVLGELADVAACLSLALPWARPPPLG